MSNSIEKEVNIWFTDGKNRFVFNKPDTYYQPSFDMSGDFHTKGFSCLESYTSDWKPASQAQIEPLIKREAELRGLITGTRFDSVPKFKGCVDYTRDCNTLIDFIAYSFKHDMLFTSNGVLYEKGRWAYTPLGEAKEFKEDFNTSKQMILAAIEMTPIDEVQESESIDEVSYRKGRIDEFRRIINIIENIK